MMVHSDVTKACDEAIWEHYRQEMMLAEGEILLNAGSYSPTPRPVFEAANRWRTRLAGSPMRALLEEMPRQLVFARQELAKYLNQPARRLLLLANATAGVNVAIDSLELPAGSRVAMTDHEYGAMKFAWERAARRRGWRIDIFPLPYRTEDPNELLDALLSAIETQPAVLFVSHVTSPTGLVLPIGPALARARERGIITIVDGAHAPGMIPLDLSGLDADFYAGNCHKWMMAPIGAGFLAVTPRWTGCLEPTVVSWGWEFGDAPADDDSGWGGSKWSQRIEFQGTADRSPALVLPEAIAFQEELHDAGIYRRASALNAYTRSRLREISLVEATPSNPSLSGPMIAFDVPPVDPIRAREWLWHKAKISVAWTRAVDRGFLRVSSAWFNSPEEIDRLAAVIPEMPWEELAR